MTEPSASGAQSNGTASVAASASNKAADEAAAQRSQSEAREESKAVSASQSALSQPPLRSIFSLKSKQQGARDRFGQRA